MLQRNRARPSPRRRAADAPAKGRRGAARAHPARRTAAVDPAADTRARILQAAEMLFAEHGFDAVSMRDITAL